MSGLNGMTRGEINNLKRRKRNDYQSSEGERIVGAECPVDQTSIEKLHEEVFCRLEEGTEGSRLELSWNDA